MQSTHGEDYQRLAHYGTRVATFLDCLRYVDQIARLANGGVSAAFHSTRHERIRPDRPIELESSPNYWGTLLLHLMGTVVLDRRVSARTTRPCPLPGLEDMAHGQLTCKQTLITNTRACMLWSRNLPWLDAKPYVLASHEVLRQRERGLKGTRPATATLADALSTDASTAPTLRLDRAVCHQILSGPPPRPDCEQPPREALRAKRLLLERARGFGCWRLPLGALVDFANPYSVPRVLRQYFLPYKIIVRHEVYPVSSDNRRGSSF